MSENLVFYSETKCIMETVIRVAVDVIGNSKVENDAEEQTMNRKVSQRLVYYQRTPDPLKTPETLCSGESGRME